MENVLKFIGFWAFVICLVILVVSIQCWILQWALSLFQIEISMWQSLGILTLMSMISSYFKKRK